MGGGGGISYYESIQFSVPMCSTKRAEETAKADVLANKKKRYSLSFITIRG